MKKRQKAKYEPSEGSSDYDRDSFVVREEPELYGIRAFARSQAMSTQDWYCTAPMVEFGRVSEVLGFSVGSTFEASAAIKRGFPVRVAERLAKVLGMSLQSFGRVTNIAERTLLRRLATSDGRLKPDESERVLRIGVLLARAADVLGALDAAKEWLRTPNQALGGRVPLEFADTEPGAREVEAVLGRIEYGVFS